MLEARYLRNVVVLFLLKSQLGNVLEGLFDVDGFFGTVQRLVLACVQTVLVIVRALPSLEVRNVTLLLAPSHSSLLADNTLVVQIDLVADNDEREVVRIARSSLNK